MVTRALTYTIESCRDDSLTTWYIADKLAMYRLNRMLLKACSSERGVTQNESWHRPGDGRWIQRGGRGSQRGTCRT